MDSIIQEVQPTLSWMVFLVFLFIAFLILMYLLKNLKDIIIIVPEGYEVIVERLGSFSRKLGKGMHYIVPFIERKKIVTWTRVEEERRNHRNTINVERTYRIVKIPVFEQLFDFPEYKVITHDLLNITVNGMLIYRIVNTKKAVYAISDLYLAFHKLIETSLRNTISKMKLVEVIRRKNEVEAKVIEDLNFIKENWGMIITKFDIQEVIPPAQFVESNRRIEQEQRLLQTKISQKENEKKCKILEEETKNQIQSLTHKRLLEKAEHEKTLKELNVDTQYYEKRKEIDHIQGMLESGIDQKYLECLEYTKAWGNLCKLNPNSTYVIPFESAKYLGVNSLAKLKEKKE